MTMIWKLIDLKCGRYWNLKWVFNGNSIRLKKLVLEGKNNRVISSHLDNNKIYTNINKNDGLVFNDVQGFQLGFFFVFSILWSSWNGNHP